MAFNAFSMPNTIALGLGCSKSEGLSNMIPPSVSSTADRRIARTFPTIALLDGVAFGQGHGDCMCCQSNVSHVKEKYSMPPEHDIQDQDGTCSRSSGNTIRFKHPMSLPRCHKRLRRRRPLLPQSSRIPNPPCTFIVRRRRCCKPPMAVGRS